MCWCKACRTSHIDEMGWEVARYHPTPRRRLSEGSRPELADVAPVAATIAELSIFWKEMWRNLEAYTEGAYVVQASGDQGSGAQTWVYTPTADQISIVCRNNLDVYSGIPGNYERFHGNLREQGAEAVFHRAMERGPVSNDALYFGSDALPSVQELAAEVGAAQGMRIYFSAVEMRQRWLDLALVDYSRQ